MRAVIHGMGARFPGSIQPVELVARVQAIVNDQKDGRVGLSDLTRKCRSETCGHVRMVNLSG